VYLSQAGRQTGRQLVSLLGKPAHFGVSFFSLCVHLFHHSARVVVRVLTTFQSPTFYYLFKLFESGFSFLSKTHSPFLSGIICMMRWYYSCRNVFGFVKIGLSSLSPLSFLLFFKNNSDHSVYAPPHLLFLQD
jgi:hypothetical protein